MRSDNGAPRDEWSAPSLFPGLGPDDPLKRETARQGAFAFDAAFALLLAPIRPLTAWLAASDITAFGTQWGTSGAATQWQAIHDDDDSMAFAHRHGDVGTFNYDMGLDKPFPLVLNATIEYVARYEGVAPVAGTQYQIGVGRSDANGAACALQDATLLTVNWTRYRVPLSFGALGGRPANSLRLTCVVPIFYNGYVEISYVKVTVP